VHEIPFPLPSLAEEETAESWPEGTLGDGKTGGIPSGIDALDDCVGGLVEGGVYLVAGAPSPAKLVGILQFLHTGLERGERGFFLTDSHAPDILEVARAWGLPMDQAWTDGRLEIVGYRDDFEMRVLRSADPEDVIEELDSFVAPGTARIAVDPGSAFFQGGARSLVGKSFLTWAENQRATVWATLVVDEGEGLPSSAEWLLNATSGVLLFEQARGGLYQVRLSSPLPLSGTDTITTDLVPGEGLVAPVGYRSRRDSDQRQANADRLLLVSCGEPPAGDLECWVRDAFTARMTLDPMEAVAALQGDEEFGSVLVYSSRKRIREAIRAVRVMRPLTISPIVVVSDDAVRSMDRVQMLDAGADDCLTGAVDVRELATRIRQAIEVGGKPEVGLGPRVAVGGTVASGVFDEELRRRAADPTLRVFGVVVVRSSEVSDEELGRVLADEIRNEDGDLVTRGADGCLVLLQGARSEAAKAFLTRFRNRLAQHIGRDPRLVFDAFAHPGESVRIFNVLDGKGSR
jgi:CheY-like chemotaxis protein